MTSASLVTIIIPCYNAEPMLERCLASCFEQTHAALQIVVVDNNSTDDSFALAERLLQGSDREFVLTKCAEQGAALTRNTGYAHAKGDYIQWLDADDQLFPEKISRQVAALEAAPAYDIAYSDWVFGRWKGDVMRETPGDLPGPHPDEFLNLLLDYWRPPNSYLLKRTAADRVQEQGGWNADSRMVDDRYYFTAQALLGARFLHVPGVLSRYNKWSDQQITAGVIPADRVATMACMYAKFRDMAGRCGRALTADQEIALGVDWSLWHLPQNGLAVTDADEERLEIYSPETGVKAWVEGQGTLSVLAGLQGIRAQGPRAQEYMVINMRVNMPTLVGREIEAYQFLNTLCQAGVIAKADGAKADDGSNAANASRP